MRNDLYSRQMKVTNKPCILLIVSEDWAFFSHRLELAREALAKGYRIIVATKISTMEERFAKENIEVIDVPFGRSLGNLFNDIKAIFLVRRCVAEFKPIIVHAVSLKMSLLAGICLLDKRNFSLLNVFTGFGYLFSSDEIKANIIRPVVKLLLKMLLQKANYWSVVQNPDDFKLLEKIRGGNRERTSVIKGSGVNIMHFPLRQLSVSRPMLILFPARLLADKGVREFVAAARIVRSIRSDVKFVLAGRLDADNPSAIPRAELENWTEEGVVEWVGNCENMSEKYRKAYLVCLPSYREGLPKSLLEAASTGRAIIATDVPGCRTICCHNKNGLLVSPRSVTDLSNAMQALLNDQKFCRRLGLKGRMMVENQFSSVKINSEFISLYGRLSSCPLEHVS